MNEQKWLIKSNVSWRKKLFVFLCLKIQIQTRELLIVGESQLSEGTVFRVDEIDMRK